MVEEGPRKGSRDRLWEVRWKDALLESQGEGSMFGTMEGVEGTIFRADRPTSDFSGQRAESEKDSDVLVLEGDVKVISREIQAEAGARKTPSATIYCDRIEWHSKLDLLVAKGNVHVESKGFHFGNAQELWCASDLSRIGTPDLYKARSNMEVRAKLALPIAAVAAMGAAQSRRITLGSGVEKFELANLTGGYSEITGPGKYKFVATGNPIQGTWGSQKTTFTTGRIEGTGSDGAKSAIVVDVLHMTGGVHIVAKRASQVAGGADQSITVDCDALDYDGGTQRMDLRGATTIFQDDKAALQSLKLTGSSGHLVLYPAGQQPNSKRAVKSADLEGPVTFVLRSRRRGATPAGGGAASWVPYTVNGKGNHLSFTDSGRKMTLSGNVEIDAENAPWIGEVRAPQVSLVFDEDGNPIRVEFNEPGTTTVSKPPLRRTPAK